MACLADEIFLLRRMNYQAKYFVPFGPLSKLLTEERIRRAIRNSGIEVYDQEITIERVADGAKRLFAILVAIGEPEFIRSFIQHDQLQNNKLDHKLPMSKPDLLSIFGKERIDEEKKKLDEDYSKTDEEREEENRRIEEERKRMELRTMRFEQTQWEYAIPAFPLDLSHRILNSSITLPFTEERFLGHGGFGYVYKITLPIAVSGLDSGHDLQIVRKELMSTDYEEERRCSAFLELLKHPNILKLLGSYTYMRKHNLLFPLASGGDLHNLLSQEKRPLLFASDEAFYIALCGLSSAIESVHLYVLKSHGLELIGCHHDLKPRNILIDGSSFILADFGLSRLRDAVDGSKSNFKRGEGFYLAPECRKLSTTSRRTDIWAFGCILAVVLTYIKRGKAGVAEFQIRRKVETSDSIEYLFHASPDCPNDGVTDWLLDLEREGMEPERKLIQLVRDMLKLVPAERPEIEEVSSRLRFVALRRVSQLICEQFAQTSHHYGKVEFEIEKLVFSTWLWGFDQIGGITEPIVQIESTFQQALDILFKLRTELKLLESRRDALYPLFIQLRRLNEQLLVLLPKDLQKRVGTRIELEILKGSHSEVLDMVEGVPGDSTANSRILILSTIKHMAAMTSERSESSEIDEGDIEITDQLESCSLGEIALTEPSSKKSVLVEWMVYGPHWQHETIGEHLFGRMVNILRLPQKTREFNALQCSGFFNSPKRNAFGLVFEFPPAPTAQVPTTLARIIESAQKKNMTVNLGGRFRLAHKLAISLLEFHKVGWLHKGISSYNIVFFTHAQDEAKSLSSPYIIGFSHSRPNQRSQFSEKLTEENVKLRDYQHPKYLYPESNNNRYLVEYDYYSLGLVLLEIGSWRPLSRLTKPEHSPTEVREYLLAKVVPQLGYFMGEKYRDAVTTCLSGELGGNSDVGDEVSVDMNFEHLVVDPLAKCSV